MSHAATLRQIAQGVRDQRERFASDECCPDDVLADFDAQIAACEAGARALEAHQWQPIEAAPEKARALVTDGQYIEVGDKEPGWVDENWGESMDEVWGDEQGKALNPQPTHWMPLPDPPALSSLEGSGVIEKQM